MPRKRREEIIDADEAIRRYYEDGTPSETEGSRDGTEPVSLAGERAGHPRRADEETTRLSGGDPDVSAQSLDVGTETPGGSNPAPDQDLVDEINRAAGVTYQDNEPLKFGEKAEERDRSRWELNPASSEDYQERRERTGGARQATSKRRSSPAANKQSRRSTGPRGERSTSTKEALMPERKTKRRAQKAKREGKAATTQAGEFVREEIHHKRRGKHPVKSRKQAIAIGLSKARRSGVKVPRKRSARSKRRRKK